MLKEKPKIALCMIVAETDKEAILLDRCLGGPKIKIKKLKDVKFDGLAKYVDGIFLTITGENKRCEDIAKKYNAVVSHYEWDKNFARARNFNFSQVPKDYKYIIWSDCDDVWENPHLISGIVETIDNEAIDTVIMEYLYDFDKEGLCIVNHLKTRIVRNDGSVKWQKARVHEDLEPTRQLLPVFNKDIKVYHLTEGIRIFEAMRRNTEISKIALEEDKKDPRNYWNLANAYITEGKYEKAIPVYLDFLGISQSEEERFLAWHRLSSAYEALGDFVRAIQSELEAFHLRPWYPDAYFGLGKLYLKTGKYRHAKELLEEGLKKEIPEHEIIVFNPRDYDYNPRMLLVETYLNLSRPREAKKHLDKCLEIYPASKNLKNIKKEINPMIKKFDYADDLYKKAKKLKDKKKIKELLDSVPKDMKYYPPIVHLRNIHFIKKESSGKDIVIYCGYTVNEWNPLVAKTKGVGGSEEAVIELSKRWAKNGWNVEVYANIPKFEGKIIDGVKWKPFMAWNYRDKQDITIIWRHPKPLDYNINSNKILIDIHDVVPIAEFNSDRIKKLYKVMFKSKIHRDLYSQIPLDKTVVISHGLDIKKFEERERKIKRNPYKLINTSSPDRSLITCLEIVERLYHKLPNHLKKKLKFRWNYGFRVWDFDFSDDEQMQQWKKGAIDYLNKLKKIGIVEKDSGDMISQEEIVDQYLESGIMLYPSKFFEIGWISGTKSMLAGCVPVTTDAFAQGEYTPEGIILKSKANYDNWVIDLTQKKDYGVEDEKQKSFLVDKLVEYFKNPEKYEPMRERLKEYAKNNFDWDKTATQWEKVFSNK